MVLTKCNNVILDYNELLRHTIAALNYHFSARLITIITHIRGFLIRTWLLDCNIDFAFLRSLLFLSYLSSRLYLRAYMFDYTL